MDKKTTGIVSYITLIGWIIAYCAGDKEGAKFHLNQSLVIWIGNLIVAILSRIPFVNLVTWVISIFLFVCWIIGLIYAIQDTEKEIPLLGQIKILK